MTGIWITLGMLAVLAFLLRERERSAADAALTRVELGAANKRLKHIIEDRKRDHDTSVAPIPDTPDPSWLLRPP